MGGDEVGGVFMENGEVSGIRATTGAVDGFGTLAAGGTPAAGDDDQIVDMSGTLIGAFGGAREIPELP